MKLIEEINGSPSAATEGFTFTDALARPGPPAEAGGKDHSGALRPAAEKTGVTLTDGEEFNRQRLMRSVEKALSGQWESPPPRPRYDCLLLGVTFPRDVVCRRIDERLQARLDAGMVEEVAALRAGGADDSFLEGLGLEYRYILWYLTENPTLDALKDELAGPSSALPSGRWCGSRGLGPACFGWTWRDSSHPGRPGSGGFSGAMVFAFYQKIFTKS